MVGRKGADGKPANAASPPSDNTVRRSPSTSSFSQRDQTNSSCATSPEPSGAARTDSQSSNLGGKEIKIGANGEAYTCGVLDDGETSFCEKLNMISCGNPNNPLEKAADLDHIRRLKERALEDMRNRQRKGGSTTLSRLTEQNGGAFNPSFGDYREPMEKINNSIKDGEPTETVFGSDPKWGFGGRPKGLDEDQDEDDDAYINGKGEKMMTCNKIWDRISHHPSFKSGELDVDGLCTELRQKAKCSESGVVVGERTLEKALKKVEAESACRASGSPRAIL